MQELAQQATAVGGEVIVTGNRERYALKHPVSLLLQALSSECPQEGQGVAQQTPEVRTSVQVLAALARGRASVV